jgi:hypothetical protein
MLDEDFMREIRRLASIATYQTSVCTGALILGAAGLLRGKRASTHWAARDFLKWFDATLDEGRVVRDGNIITGGGVTAQSRGLPVQKTSRYVIPVSATACPSMNFGRKREARTASKISRAYCSRVS